MARLFLGVALANPHAVEVTWPGSRSLIEHRSRHRAGAPPIAHSVAATFDVGPVLRHRLHALDHDQALADWWRRLPQPHAVAVDVKTGFWIGAMDLRQQAGEEFPEGAQAGVPLPELLLQAD